MTINGTSLDTMVRPDSLAGGGNALLALMTGEDRDLITANCSRRWYSRGDILATENHAADAIYFIEQGVASLIKPFPSDAKTEIALLGPETFVGTPVITSDGAWPYRTFVQVDRLCAIRVPIGDARNAIEVSPSLFKFLVKAVHTQIVQIAEGLVSAVWQQIDARLARWLLMYRDRLRSSRVEVTHEFMALMIGAQRTGVTEALHRLEGAGLITATRGLVVIRDESRLKQLAAQGYGTSEQETAQIF